MGISGLNKLLQRIAPRCFLSVFLKTFSGRRIAIDASEFMYSYMSIARKKHFASARSVEQLHYCALNTSPIQADWIQMHINFFCDLLSHNITPIFVLDGQHPIEKTDTKNKRKESNNILKSRIAEFIENPYANGNVQSLQSTIRDFCNCRIITTENYEALLNVIRYMGIPILTATGDGEQLCSVLAIQGHVAAVYSTDTDNLAYGCPLLITKISKNVAECVRHDAILLDGKMTQSSFRDLCIMSGCDFNKNMPGYAAIKSYNLIQKHQSIDNLPSSFDISCLNHIRCREIFSFVPYLPSSSLSVLGPQPSYKDFVDTINCDFSEYYTLWNTFDKNIPITGILDNLTVSFI